MKLKPSCLYFVKPIIIGLCIALLVILSIKLLPAIIDSSFSKDNDVVSYNDAIQKAAPAVVNIYSQRYIDSSIDNKQHLQPTGLGSGIITDSKGYILTNYHVISKADQILVALQDGRLFTASVIGSDRITDLAVLHIEGEDLPVIPQSQKYQPRVGDIVFAIGNPYNLGQTVTQGIISATGRNGMSSSGRQDFLQTDAAINEGNSGGALINSRGDLVGINTSEFYSNNKSSSGISFAIPYQLSKRVMESLIKDGRVIRGSLGVVAENLDPLLARLTGLKAQNSIIIIKSVHPNGPAAIAGVKANDLLLKIDGDSLGSLVEAMDKVTELKPGTKITLTLLREGQQIKIDVVVGDFKNTKQITQ